MSHLTLVSNGPATSTSANPALERKARHLRALINVIACDGGDRLVDELTEETRGDYLEMIEDLASDIQALTART